jgi:hypothetical protein
MSLKIHTLKDILSKSGSTLETLHIENIRELRAIDVGMFEESTTPTTTTTLTNVSYCTL